VTTSVVIAARRNDFEARLIESMQALGAELYAWIILPNHYHFLVGIDLLNRISRVLQRLHGVTSRESSYMRVHND
jgi:putative transposase